MACYRDSVSCQRGIYRFFWLARRATAGHAPQRPAHDPLAVSDAVGCGRVDSAYGSSVDGTWHQK